MPRSGWIAIGAVTAALAVTSGDRRLVAAAFLIVAAVLLAATVGFQRRILLAVAIGGLVVLARGVGLPVETVLTGAPDGDGPWSMVVESVGSPRDGEQVATVRTLDEDPRGFRLAATLPRYPAIEPGDRLEVGGRVRPRPDSPYGRYLERIGAWGTLDAREMSLIGRPVDPSTTLESLRRGAGDSLARVLPEPEAGLAAGILIGLRDRVDRMVAADFTSAGVSHVVAISGWNIAIVAGAIGAIAGRLGRRRRAVITAVAIVAYIAFAGASPSVLRAGAMAGVVLIARETGRAGRAAAALGWAATTLLVADPRLVGDAGFQLSTLATAGLIAWATPLAERLDRWTGHHLPRWLTESLGVSLAAQMATLPVVLATFGRLALIAPAVDLAVVPLVVPAMAAGVVALVGGLAVELGAPLELGTVLATPAWVALRLMIGIVGSAAAFPLANVALEPPAGTFAAAGVIVAAIGARAWRHPRRPRLTRPVETRRPRRPAASPRSLRLAGATLAVAVTVTAAVAISRSGSVARLTVLDVGQGDAILVEGERGARLLVDGGPDPDRLLVALDRRIPPWDRRIDAVILSHPHEDHVAGLALLLERYRVGRVYEPGMRGPGPGYAAWLERLGLGGRARSSIAAGDRLSVDGIDMHVLWPVRGQVPVEPPDDGTGINNVSVVLLGSVGNRRFLLAGDVEEEVDPRLLADGLPTVDLLKVAHHGSRTATTEAFVQTVRPRIAVASAGAGNRYGHPARATLDRLMAAGARVYRTDRDGSVSVTFGLDGTTVRTDPPRAPVVARTASPSVAARASFLCAVPLQPFVAQPAPMEVLQDPGRTSALGYHPADEAPVRAAWRCPALPPPRRWTTT